MRIVGIDYGERRLGVAVSDPDGVFAMPLRVIEVSRRDKALDAARRLCAEEEPDEIVVGLPLNMDGTVGPMAHQVQTFCARLSRCVEVPVKTWDERLSTTAAERALLAAGAGREQRRRSVDKVAAQTILQAYLDAKMESAGACDSSSETQRAMDSTRHATRDTQHASGPETAT